MFNQIRLTDIVKKLLIVNIAVFVLGMLGIITGDIFQDYFLLYKLDILNFHGQIGSKEFQPVQIVGHFFAHGGVMHIAFNMMALVFFGPQLEQLMGNKRFLAFYLFCGVVGGILVTLFDPSFVPVIGASGALSGVLVATAFYFPNMRIGILFLPFSFKAKDFAIGVAAISAGLVVAQVLGIIEDMSISHFGHLMGMVAAVLFYYVEKFIPLGE
ncbi:MAG: rhomboid family intramembrane serine protease [Bacteroidota bacterium]